MTDDPGASVPSLDSPEPSSTTGGSRIDTAVVALGAGLVAAVVVLSAFHSRAGHDLDWSNYSMGILATAGLLGVSAASHLLARGPARSEVLIAWTGALGAVGAGLMIAVGMDDHDATFYVAGAVVVGLSVGGYLYLTRHGAFVLSTIAGLVMLYANLYDDVIGTDANGEGGNNFGMLAAAAILIFAAAVTAAGWRLPSRDLSGVTVGFVALAANLVVLYTLFIFSQIQMYFDGFDESPAESYDPTGDGSLEEAGFRMERFDKYDDDVWVILLVSLVLCAGWAWCSWQTGHVGYRLLILASLVTVVPSATLVLAAEHPTYWEAVAGVVGAAALAFAGLRATGGIAGLPRLKASRGA